MSRRVPPTFVPAEVAVQPNYQADEPPPVAESSRRVPPSRTTIQDLPEPDEAPTLVAGPSTPTEIGLGFNEDKFGEILAKPNMVEEMMAHVQSNPQTASMVRNMVNDPAARREMNRMIQNTGADLQMMNSLKKNKGHRNERPKRKEILKLQKQNKALMRAPKVDSMKLIKITIGRKLNQIEVPSEGFPHNCVSKISTDPDAILGIKVFNYLVDEKEQYVTLLYVEDSKRVNKLIKAKFGAEYGGEVLVLSGTVDNPSELTPDQFNKLPVLKPAVDDEKDEGVVKEPESEPVSN